LSDEKSTRLGGRLLVAAGELDDKRCDLPQSFKAVVSQIEFEEDVFTSRIGPRFADKAAGLDRWSVVL
jgi:hypothetical protein